MSEDRKLDTTPKLCFECKEMFGHPSFKDMCSKCFKRTTVQLQKKNELPLTKKPTDVGLSKQSIDKSNLFRQKLDVAKQERQKEIKQDNVKREQPKQIQKQIDSSSSKCFTCNKKIGLLGYNCGHCTQKYCKFHRLPQDHICKVDFISEGKKKLKLQNPILVTSKIEKI